MKTSYLALGAALAAGLATGCLGDAAPGAAGDYEAKRLDIRSADQGVPLSFPSSARAPEVVRDFAAAQRGIPADHLRTTREHRAPASGLTHVRMVQERDGLRIYGAYIKAALNDQGEIVHMIDNLVNPGDVINPGHIDADAALDIALAAHHPGLDRATVQAVAQRDQTTIYGHDGFFWREPTVTRVLAPLTDGALTEAFLVETWSDRDNLLHETLVGGDGRILHVELRTAQDSYGIFADHPGVSAQEIVAGPGAGNTESPVGWLFSGTHSSVDIAGNNVHAYLDTDANGSPDSGGNSVSDGNFVSVVDLGQDPNVAINKDVAVQNLFYFNNVIHDKLYQHGFTETAGNFQEDNFGRGGQGSDSVNAEGQDGGGLNNANFSTPSDGSNPRMQMFLWDKSSPRRDGDVDSDIIWHEYGHGLTNRMIGGMGGSVSGAIGEGMSDVLAILINDDDVVGEYSFNDPLGIRSEPYTGYSRTYGDFSNSSGVHFNGEIYAATIWRLWLIFQQEGVSQDTLFDYLVGGMNFTPSSPAYEDMRDGILQAAAGTGHECLIWQAFAEFGIGVGAQASVSGPFGGTVTITESFALPSECSGGQCTPTEATEVSCSDGLDNDCDGLTDSADPDCALECTPAGATCSADSDCCSNKCRGKRGDQTCR
ncbi:M36 family metallopeptidase [Haliangium sp.]|uniref:M36 family metallopeptidase n=1 Tax=Haliangium sp. TaxID=2663208 RepID=UPI003D11E0C5